MGILGEALNTVLNLDVAVMTAKSRAWAVTEELKAECRYQAKKISEKVEEIKSEVEAEKQLHPEDDANEEIQGIEDLQNGLDFTALQSTEVPLVNGTEYEVTGCNPALQQVTQEHLTTALEQHKILSQEQM